MPSYPVPPPDGAVRWAKYRSRFERDVHRQFSSISAPNPSLICEICGCLVRSVLDLGQARGPAPTTLLLT